MRKASDASAGTEFLEIQSIEDLTRITQRLLESTVAESESPM